MKYAGGPRMESRRMQARIFLVLHLPCLLVRLTATSFVAFSQKCTHLSCAVFLVPPKTASTAPATRDGSTCEQARRPPDRRAGR